MFFYEIKFLGIVDNREGAGGGAGGAIAPPIFWKGSAVTMTSQK